MGDFVMADREYPRLPELLLKEAPGFGDSDEYGRLDPGDSALPSVVAGAFTRYVERLFSDAVAPVDSRVAQVEEALSAMERLASSPDPEVINTLVVEVFEHLDLPGGALPAFRSRLGPSARAVYDRWIPPRGGQAT
jgi:hypothetical protein